MGSRAIKKAIPTGWPFYQNMWLNYLREMPNPAVTTLLVGVWLT
jgi:hypothetical protein